MCFLRLGFDPYVNKGELKINSVLFFLKNFKKYFSTQKADEFLAHLLLILSTSLLIKIGIKCVKIFTVQSVSG